MTLLLGILTVALIATALGWRRAAKRAEAMASALQQTRAELARIERETAQQGAQLDALLQGLSEAVVRVDRRGHVQQANARARAWLGIDRLGISLRAFYRDPDWWDALEAHLGSGKSGALPVMRVAHRILEPRVIALADGSFLLIALDVTARAEAEAARKRFLDGLLHDLKTPIAALLGSARSIEAFGDEDEALRKELAAGIAEEAKSVARLLDQLLALEAPQEEGCSDAASVAQSAVERAQRRRRKLKITYEADRAPLPVAVGEATLARALDNLLENALAHAKSRVSVRLQSDEAHILLEVRDNGMGVPEEALPRLGERFFRVDAARSRKRGGHGLGLAIVKEGIERCGGKVRFANAPEGGLIVRLWLPKAQESDSS